MFPKLTAYGAGAVASVVVFSVAIVLLSFLVDSLVVRILILVIAMSASGFTLFFFRDPDRVPSTGSEDAVIAPADGKVINVSTVDESEFLQSRARMVSIFMSPANVHVNRIPVSGTVKFLKYVKGEYLVAFHEKSSEKNERMLIGIENRGQRILLKQIAGFMARRIVCALSEGREVTAGERFGMIKFGSRVDVFLPMNCDLRVKLNDRTLAGNTVLGVLQNE